MKWVVKLSLPMTRKDKSCLPEQFQFPARKPRRPAGRCFIPLEWRPLADHFHLFSASLLPTGGYTLQARYSCWPAVIRHRPELCVAPYDPTGLGQNFTAAAI